MRAVSLDQQVDALLLEPDKSLQNRCLQGRSHLAALTQALVLARHRYRQLVKAMREGGGQGGRVLPYGWDARVEDSGTVIFFAPETGQTSQDFPTLPALGGREGGQGLTGRRLEQLGAYQAYCGEVTRLVEQIENLSLEVGRGEVRLLGMGPGAGPDRLRAELETNICDSAHIVLTTLNTAGTSSITSGARFTVVVVDEAAQAIEPSTLIPLQTGAETCVLVGDPQQLPATVFSSLGAATAFERSLFERLEHGGHPVHLLDTQYRMHPAISAFPRRYFYGKHLKDGENVFSPAYSRPWHAFPAFQPFAFLDLKSDGGRGRDKGREGGGGLSYRNSAEARLLVNVYQTLRREAKGQGVRGKVGVITPYQAQLMELHAQFARALGPSYQEEVELNTVDGCQGKEKDVILFSCVRAGGKRGIGFLADVRRMNVGLTRGRVAMLVVGRAETLQQNLHWKALLDHARTTGAFVKVPHPGCNLLGLQRGGGKGGGREGGCGGGKEGDKPPATGPASLSPALPPSRPPARPPSFSPDPGSPTPSHPPSSVPPLPLPPPASSLPPQTWPSQALPSATTTAAPLPPPLPSNRSASTKAISYSPPPSFSPPPSPPRRRARMPRPPAPESHSQDSKAPPPRPPPPAPPNPYLMLAPQPFPAPPPPPPPPPSSSPP